MTAAVRARLKRWYRIHGRHDLPWRTTGDPYAILVSEVMLQQTQVDRVTPYYHRWLDRWPTVEALARATPADAIREWAGLGYNRRPLHLHRAAVTVVEQHGGTFPGDPASLRHLPGVGPYTAAALGSFAFHQPVAVIDTNIARVIARAWHGLAGQREVPSAMLAVTASALLPRHNARDHNLALMDLGALVCTARNPACDECPLRSSCAWRAAGSPASPARLSSAPRFQSTARYARGRIIAALRECDDLTTARLTTMLPADHQGHVTTYLLDLARDGLITATPSGWSLPHGKPPSPLPLRSGVTVRTAAHFALREPAESGPGGEENRESRIMNQEMSIASPKL